jgi:hypothetical protein
VNSKSDAPGLRSVPFYLMAAMVTPGSR